MKPSVREAFVPFTSRFEGVVRWLYLDVKGLVTTAIGNLVDPVEAALSVPFLRGDGTPASRAEIAAEWQRVKDATGLAHLGYRAAQAMTSLRLDDAGIASVVARKLDENDAYLRHRFPDFDDWPADAQLATHSMAWACGPAFHFPKLESALKARDFAAAAEECEINSAGNPGVVPRNAANKALYHNASLVDAYKLDPDDLVYPNTIGPAPPVEPMAIVHPDVPFEPRRYDSDPTLPCAPAPSSRQPPVEIVDDTPDDEPPAAA